MKKLLALLLAMIMVFALAACGGTQSAPKEEAKPAAEEAAPAEEAPAEEAPAAEEAAPAEEAASASTEASLQSGKASAVPCTAKSFAAARQKSSREMAAAPKATRQTVRTKRRSAPAGSSAASQRSAHREAAHRRRVSTLQYT